MGRNGEAVSTTAVLQDELSYFLLHAAVMLERSTVRRGNRALFLQPKYQGCRLQYRQKMVSSSNSNTLHG